MGGARGKAVFCSAVRRADGLDDYFRSPLGRYLVGDCFLHWYAAADLCGFAVWGRPGEQQAQRIVQALDVELEPALPHDSLVDLRRVEGIDADAFGVMKDYMQAHASQFARTVRRQVLLRPDGLAGAIVGGFYELVQGGYPHKVFTDAAEGLSWLGRDADMIGPLVSRLNALVAEATGQSPLLRELHQVLRGKLPGASLADVARTLGMSERTLQRRLKEADTSFQTELNTVQVRTAQGLLLETDMKLTAVAVEVGCASLQHFSSLFRKWVGETPSGWRERHRGGPPTPEGSAAPRAAEEVPPQGERPRT
ncbi:helix-turn-helix transcriptional regulator [Corallococcus sp. M34]|nr:helix-turn-helix transcriptional regulator [Citreicoccus inhibens]